MSWGVSPWVYPVWHSLGFLDLGDYFLPHFREIFNYYLLKYFLMVFLFVFFFWTPMIRMLGRLTLSQRSLRLSSFLLILFSFFLCFLYFYHSIFHLTNPIFCLHYSTICCLQSVFLSHLLRYSLYIDPFFISSRSLLNLSCIFSILVSRLFICDFIFISRFWIIFTIIIRNYLSDRLPISSSCLVWWVFILFLYLLCIPLCLHLVYIAVFGVAFRYSGSLWSSIYC